MHGYSSALPRVLSEVWPSNHSSPARQPLFRRVTTDLPTTNEELSPNYGTIVSPTQQLSQWFLKRTSSFDSAGALNSNMPNLRTLLKRSHSKTDVNKMKKSDAPSDAVPRSVIEIVTTPPEDDFSEKDFYDCASVEDWDFSAKLQVPTSMRREASSKSLASPTNHYRRSSRDISDTHSLNSMGKCDTILAFTPLFGCKSAAQVSLRNESKKSRGNISKLNMIQRIANTSRSRLSLLASSRLSVGHEILVDRSLGSDGNDSGIDTMPLCTPCPLQTVNRLRVPPSSSQICSRCSSLLSMVSSRLSLNPSVCGEDEEILLCRICLRDVKQKEMKRIGACGCCYCSECLLSYVSYEIDEGAYDISCPDSSCDNQGVISVQEIDNMVDSKTYSKYQRFRFNQEVERDVARTWCPRAGCETVCSICTTAEKCLPQSVSCPSCTTHFCSNCKRRWHQGLTCQEAAKKRKNFFKGKKGESRSMDSDTFSDACDEFVEESGDIKRCPTCNVPIEKDAGCAQMMCKRCKHVFCWYCLESLDDDFLLRHYDKGPCKNKLGHSRASVLWHRTQVVGIFAGFGLLLLVASPLLLLAAPFVLCCRCKLCSRLEDESSVTSSVQPSILAGVPEQL